MNGTNGIPPHLTTRNGMKKIGKKENGQMIPMKMKTIMMEMQESETSGQQDTMTFLMTNGKKVATQRTHGAMKKDHTMMDGANRCQTGKAIK